MKRFAMFCAAVLAACGMASAQTSADAIRVHFDRPVMAAGTELAAGDYTIQIMPASGNVVLSVRSDAGRQAALLVNPLRIRAGASAKGESVTLIRRGDQYWLDQVWLAPDVGFEVLQPAQ